MTLAAREDGAAFADAVYADQDWGDAEFAELIAASLGGPPAPPPVSAAPGHCQPGSRDNLPALHQRTAGNQPSRPVGDGGQPGDAEELAAWAAGLGLATWTTWSTTLTARRPPR